jgi:hypothetical protein
MPLPSALDRPWSPSTVICKGTFMPAIRPNRAFLLKSALAAGMVAAADGLFYGDRPNVGWNIGLYALALAGAALAVHPALRRSRTALGLWLLAFLFGLIQIETVSLLASGFFWLALMLAVMACRAGGRPDTWPWIQRLVPAGFYALAKPVLDARRLWRASPGVRLIQLGAVWQVLILPLLGGSLFLLLFATANPVIQTTLGRLAWPDIDIWRVTFWGVALVVSWCVLRPPFRRRPRLTRLPAAWTPAIASDAAILLSLVVFNALFAVENGLDLAFLWSGAPLPGRVTLADYAHKGAFSLIVAALLVAAFVLAALDPRSPSARVKGVRGLVVAWIAQTVFLVASCILRTWDYVESYSLTGFRICALAWMGLVAAGLVLVCWRLLRGKSSAWLLNANLAAAGAVLAVLSVVDVNAVSAAWDVRHAREVAGTGVALDLCFLENQGESAMVSLAELLRKPINEPLRRRAARALADVTEQSDRNAGYWRSWTWRRTRRRARVDAIVRGLDWRRDMEATCEPVTAPPAAPLTSAPHA